MKSLDYFFKKAVKETWAIPHFNVSNIEQLKGVCEAAAHLKSPVMIGASEGERDYIGIEATVALVRAYREKYGIPLFLNADHTKSVSAAKKAIDAGFDSIHIDLSKKPYKENAAGTREVVQYARKKNKAIHVEGELGYLMTDSSKVYKEKIAVDSASLTKPEEALRFVRETGINRLAPAVGNLHGIAANRPKLNFPLIQKLRRTIPLGVSLVLHGGSGNSPAAFKKVIALGFTNIHISTELRIAYRKALELSLKKQPDEVAPYKIGTPAIAAVQKRAEFFITLFGSAGKK
ncbi:MAG: class II fructose-bisphosphate aldolase [bacterium]|nr:class II fructose-bisphosphate aldolase [bacterium]